MAEGRLTEILKKAKQKEERPKKDLPRSSRLIGFKKFLQQFRAISPLHYITYKKDESEIDSRVVTYYSPSSPVSEQYRIFRTNIFSIENKVPPKSILLTSAHEQEGKTITAVNLAITMAQDSNKKVLLIDADLRKGEIKGILNLPKEEGLAELLKGQVKVDEVIQETKIPGLSVIVSGVKPENPAELLGQSKMKEILEDLKEKYDQIILDSSPVISVTDGAILGPKVDGVILAIRAEATRLEVVEHAQFLLKQANSTILGFILTNVEYHIPEYIHKYL